MSGKDEAKNQPTASKSKRVRPRPVRRDPVIAALIAKLPAEGGRFDRAMRINWLRMIAMAFDGAFGVEPPFSIDTAALVRAVYPSGGSMSETPSSPAAPPAPITAPAEPDEIRYYVDANGFARVEPGNQRIKPFDVPVGSTLEDEREGEGELDTIKWADGPWPPEAYAGHSLIIVKA